MRYYQEFMRACKTTVAVVFLLAVIKVIFPVFVTGTLTVEPVAFLFSVFCTTAVCLVFFTLTNIWDTKRRNRKGEAGGRNSSSKTKKDV